MLKLLILASAFILSLPVAKACEEHAKAKQAEAQTVSLVENKKWKTDKPLRENMVLIKKVMESDFHAMHEGKLSSEKFVEVSEKVTKAIGTIFKECKLEPKADEALHGILKKMMDGAEVMKSGATTNDKFLGAAKVVEALDTYRTQFDHPGWKPIQH